MPETLREISGVSNKLPPLNESVILIIDAQKEYTSGRLSLVGIEQSVKSLEKFLTKARKKGIPVIHIVHHALPSSPVFGAGSEGAGIIDELAPVCGESIIVKSFPSAFTGTDLLAELEKFGRKNLLVCGYMTHMCVSSTVRAATEKGYNCTIVSDFTATRDLPAAGGVGVIEAGVVKSAVLAALADRFVLVVENESQLRWE